MATSLSWLSYFRALKLAKAAQVAPIDKLSVLLITIFAAMLLGERMELTGRLGIGLIAGGAVPVAVS